MQVFGVTLCLAEVHRPWGWFALRPWWCVLADIPAVTRCVVLAKDCATLVYMNDDRFVQNSVSSLTQTKSLNSVLFTAQAFEPLSVAWFGYVTALSQPRSRDFVDENLCLRKRSFAMLKESRGRRASEILNMDHLEPRMMSKGLKRVE